MGLILAGEDGVLGEGLHISSSDSTLGDGAHFLSFEEGRRRKGREDGIGRQVQKVNLVKKYISLSWKRGEGEYRA